MRNLCHEAMTPKYVGFNAFNASLKIVSVAFEKQDQEPQVTLIMCSIRVVCRAGEEYDGRSHNESSMNVLCHN